MARAVTSFIKLTLPPTTVCVWGGGVGVGVGVGGCGGCGCVGDVRVRVCRIYIHCLLLLENLCSIDHLVVFYILPQQ